MSPVKIAKLIFDIVLGMYSNMDSIKVKGESHSNAPQREAGLKI